MKWPSVSGFAVFSGLQCISGLRCCFWFAVCFLLTAIWWFQECDGTDQFRCCYWEFKVYWIVEKETQIRSRTEIAAEKKVKGAVCFYLTVCF